jgi:membrane glycosyltransferase
MEPRFDDDVGLSAWLDIGGVNLTLLLFALAMTMLTLPKLLAWLLAVRDRGRRRGFGGVGALSAGVVAEHALSALIAPILMLMNTSSVIMVMLGRTIGWGTQRRDVEGIDWRGILVRHAPHVTMGLAWAVLARRLNPAFFWWMLPVTAGLVLSIPLSILLSGTARRGRGGLLFTTPQERTPPVIVTHLEKRLDAIRQRIGVEEWLRPHYGIMQVALDPYVNAVHASLLRQKRRLNHRVTDYLARLQERLLEKGPASLGRREQMALLMNASSVLDLHDRLWRLPDARLSEWWRLAMRYYNTLAIRPASPLYR